MNNDGRQMDTTASTAANRRYVELNIADSAVSIDVLLTGPEADVLIEQLREARAGLRDDLKITRIN